MKSRKKIWQLQHQTVCKVLGMATDLKDMRKIAAKFGISTDNTLMDEEFALHSTVVHLCGKDNKVSRSVQKLLETRFARYANRLKDKELPDLIACVTDGTGELKVPLWAILWDLGTRGLENGKGVETALFGFIHMLEHRLLREHGKALMKRSEDEEKQGEMAAQFLALKRNLLDLQRENKQLRSNNESLRSRLAALENSPRKPDPDRAQPRDESTRTRHDHRHKVERLSLLLQETRERERALEEKCARLEAENEVLASEPADTDRGSDGFQSDGDRCPCIMRRALIGKRVAVVGGIDSLERHYREMIESMGATFHRHNGACRGGDRPLDACISKADLVICPIGVNSHNAAKSVKKMCKIRGVPCCFPRSASITGVKKALEDHYTREQVA